MTNNLDLAAPKAAEPLDEHHGERSTSRAALLAEVAPPRSDRVIRRIGFLSPIILILIWQFFSGIGMLDPRFFPAPSSIVGEFFSSLASGRILSDLWVTLVRAFSAYAAGAVPALVLGLALGLTRRIQLLVVPIFKALYPVPKIATLPLLLLIFGLGETPKIIAIAVGVFFLVFFNTLSGVVQIPRTYLDVAKNAGVSRRQMFWTVAIPGSLPSIFTGLRLAIANAFIMVTAVEFVSGDNGIGYLIWNAWQTFYVAQMYIGIVLISVVGYVATLLVDVVERTVAPWQGH